VAKTYTTDPQVFALNISEFVNKAKEAPEKVVRRAGTDVATALVIRSPVDTGRFRANWVCAFHSPSAFITPSTDKSGAGTIARITTQLNGWSGGDIYFTNSLPYAIPLEYGHSDQAPNGMVRLTVNEWNGIVEKAAKEVEE